MKSSAAKCLLYGSVVLLLLLFIQANAYATPVSFSVNVDTTSLVGTYEAGFVLLDASGLGDANNTVTIDDFAYGGGSAGAVDPTFTIGGATGDLSSGIDLVDSSPGINGIASFFTPGSSLSFLVTMTTNPDTTIDPTTGQTGDEFVLVLFNGSGNEVATTDPSGNDFLADAEIGPGGVTVNQFAIVTPEPPTLLLLCCGLAALGLGMTRKPRFWVRRGGTPPRVERL